MADHKREARQRDLERQLLAAAADGLNDAMVNLDEVLKITPRERAFAIGHMTECVDGFLSDVMRMLTALPPKHFELVTPRCGTRRRTECR
jgi:hypothetical protein